MIKKNNKGFTLLELLISIFILTIVIFLGYRVINKSTMDIKNQGNINKGQLTVNDMNEYLTKDLEQARNVQLFISNNNSEQEYPLSNIDKEFQSIIVNNPSKYKYSIILDNIQNKISYEVNLSCTNNQYRYSVSRIDNFNTRIEFIDSEVLHDIKNVPFSIKGDNPYEVNIQYAGKDYNVVNHKFDIMSRYLEASIIPSTSEDSTTKPPDTQIVPPSELPGDIPDEIKPSHPNDINKESSLCMGYWMMDTSKYNPQNHRGDLYAWIDNKGEYGNQGENKERFYIRGDNANGNSGHSNAYMRNPNDSKNLIEVNNTTNKANNLHKIKIYVSPHTKIEQTQVIMSHATFKGIKDLKTYKSLVPENNKYTLSGDETGKWYEVEFILTSNNKANFIIDGILSIDKSKTISGYGLIIYGQQANADILYQWTKDNNAYSVNAYSIVGSDNSPRNETQNNEVRNMSIQIDRGSNPAIIRSRGLDSEIATSDLKFKEIKYISLKVEGKLVLSDIKFNGKDMGSLDFSNASIVLNLEKMSDSIEANFNFKNMKENGDWGNLIINLIY